MLEVWREGAAGGSCGRVRVGRAKATGCSGRRWKSATAPQL